MAKNARMPTHPVIINNSPLVALWMLNHLPLLRELYTEVWMPEEVKNEFLRVEPTAREDALKNAPWLRTFPKTVQPPLSMPVKLDPGEAAVITLAIEHNARLVIIDEQRARRYAQHLGLSVKGTVGVLLEAKENGLIEHIKPLLTQMQTNGIYLGESVIDEALQQAGEKA